jgi:hypothetical protein
MASAGTVQGVKWVEDSSGVHEYLEDDKDLYGILTGCAEDAQRYARGIAPVLTGAYRDSISYARDPDDVGVVFYSEDNKAHWIEYGAEHTPRLRVMGRAMDQIRV